MMKLRYIFIQSNNIIARWHHGFHHKGVVLKDKKIYKAIWRRRISKMQILILERPLVQLDMLRLNMNTSFW